jgi:hypothetical protein
MRQQAKKSEKEYWAHDEKTWRLDYFNPDSGGYLATSRQRIAHSHKSKNEAAKLQKEHHMATVFAQNGYKMELLNEGTQLPDVRINGELADLKCTTSHNNIVRYAKKAVREQGAKMVLFQFDEMSNAIQDELYILKTLGIPTKYFVARKENEVVSL